MYRVGLMFFIYGKKTYTRRTNTVSSHITDVLGRLLTIRQHPPFYTVKRRLHDDPGPSYNWRFTFNVG